VPLCDPQALMSEKNRDALQWDIGKEQLNGEGVAEPVRMALWNFGEFEEGLKPSLPFADGALCSFDFPVQKKCPSLDFGAASNSRMTKSGRTQWDRHTRLLGVKEEFVSRNSIHTAPHRVANSHSGIAEDEDECPEVLRVLQLPPWLHTSQTRASTLTISPRVKGMVGRF
jgi:hypothetical protein